MLNKEINHSGLKRFTGIAILSGIITYFLKDFVKGSDAISILATIFSILAGFIIVTLTMLSDPSQFTRAGWRKVSIFKKIAEHELSKQKTLFTGYIIALSAIFISFIVKEINDTLFGIVQFFYLWVAFICLYYSMFLPSTIIRIQLQKLDHIIEHKKELSRKLNKTDE